MLPGTLHQIAQIAATAADVLGPLQDRGQRNRRMLRTHDLGRLLPGAWADPHAWPGSIGGGGKISPGPDLPTLGVRHDVRAGAQHHPQWQIPSWQAPHVVGMLGGAARFIFIS